MYANQGPIRVTLVVMTVCKSLDLATYKISSISRKISALRDGIKGEAWRRQRREEETDDCREKRSFLLESTHWFLEKIVAAVASGSR